MEPKLEKQLEQLIDKYGLTSVVDGICSVCYGKAEHIRSSYQDMALAQHWEASGHSLVQSPLQFPS